MANGRPPDDGSPPPFRPRRSQGANAGGLEALGKQVPGGASSRPLANQQGLQALGAQIDRGGSRRSGGGGRRSGKRRRTAGQRVLRIGIAFVALLVLIAAGGYGYFRYEFGKIKTAACPSCAQVASGAPYNVLVIGSDTRAGETAAEAKQFGNQVTAGGQRSDTIKIIHVDPKTGTASTLSIPRDTFVTLSGVPASSGVSTKNKLNASFAVGPNDANPSGTGANGVVKTIENTFGIPITHWIVVNFFGLTDAVQALGGVSMDVPYPVKDYGDCNGNGVLENCTGLNIQTVGCQTLSGAEALALSRSRHFEWYQNGEWHSDLSGDIGRIERQDLIIEAVVNRAKSTYNPIKAVSFINAMTHDVTLDNKLGPTALLSLAQRYHAFSGSSLQNYTMPTGPGYYAPYSEDVELVQEPAAQQIITAFLGTAPNTATTPPLDQYGQPESTSISPPTTSSSATTGTTAAGGSAATAPTSSAPAYDPRPC